MNIYLCEQEENNDWDTYDSFVCVANNEDEARNTLPSVYEEWGEECYCWCSSPDKVTVTLVGAASRDQKAGVICASFNAG